MHRLTVRAEKPYSAVERSGNHPVDVILEKLSLPGVEKAPCPRFKEWTSDEKGLEFTLPTVMPPVPNNIAFGPFNFEREPVQMARCITADLLCDKYGVQVEPGGVYSPAPHWWLLVTAPRVETIVEQLHLLSCLILCFHIVDWYRGKVNFAWWLELIITCFATYPKIRLLDEWTHTFEVPLFPKAALGTLDTWVKAGSDNRAILARYGKTWLRFKDARLACASPPIMDPDENVFTREPYIQIQPNRSRTTKLTFCKQKATLCWHAPLT